MSIPENRDEGERGRLLCPGAEDPARPGRRRGPRDRVQGDRRSGAAPAAQLHGRPAGGRGMRLPSGPAARAGAADREPSPEGADRGRAIGARAPGHLDVLSPRARARGGAPTGAGAPVRETGGEEVRMTLGRRLTAEGIGTALVLAAVVGSGIMGERLAGGNVALVLLANTLATGAALVALLLTFGPISGAHLNPAVTLAEASRGGLRWRDVPGYLGAQVAGAVVGVAVADPMFGEPGFPLSRHERPRAAPLPSELGATFRLL